MRRLESTLATPEENLALDEALLDWAEEDRPREEFLRLWESPRPIVVVGRSSRVAQEVDIEVCRERNIPILRRSSGGAAIVAGPGCLMYAVVLSYELRPELKDIRQAHCFVLSRLADALGSLLKDAGHIEHAGTSDLIFAHAVGPPQPPRKISGNSLRAKRTHMLYHGTLLYNFDLSLIDACLRMPPRQPNYRHARPHGDFVMNLSISRPALVQALDDAWPTAGNLSDWPAKRVASLVAERFSRESWNFEFR